MSVCDDLIAYMKHDKPMTYPQIGGRTADHQVVVPVRHLKEFADEIERLRASVAKLEPIS